MAMTETAVEPSTYLADYEALKASLPGEEPEGVGELRRQAADRFATLGFPTVRLEEWKYTSVAEIAKTAFRRAPDPEAPGRELAEPFRYPGCAQLVVVNGRFAPELSELDGLPAGVVVTGLAAALASEAEKVEPHLGRFARFEEHAFVALNTALLQDGAFVHVPAGTVVEKPIHVLCLALPGRQPQAAYPRNLFVAGEGSQLTVIENFASAGEGAFFTCPVTEIVVGPGAVVDHYKLEQESRETFHLASQVLHQERDSAFSSQSLSWGGKLVRNDLTAYLDGAGGDATLNGLYMVEDRQHVDNHMRVEHIAPHCGSHELYKGILEDRSRAVFNGRIYVHRGAQKTDAKQTNRNLLLSREALCNSNPQLEIFADDVKCTHGSTVGQLDADAIFYLRSRGIGEDAARSLLTYAFASDIVQRIKFEPLRRHLEEFLFRRLPKGEIVRQAV